MFKVYLNFENKKNETLKTVIGVNIFLHFKHKSNKYFYQIILAQKH